LSGWASAHAHGIKKKGSFKLPTLPSCQKGNKKVIHRFDSFLLTLSWSHGHAIGRMKKAIGNCLLWREKITLQKISFRGTLACYVSRLADS
jgi:hypothetical protein